MKTTDILILIFLGIPLGTMVVCFFLIWEGIMRFWQPNIFIKLCCGVFAWHSHGYNHVHKSPKDPLSFLVFAQCKWCGYKGQIDSQGNLF
ncbi:MAG: hypothetical protein KAJ07_00300 [Planctomycetes bacterium]|nr:hypothetical protein [Planctomycetota bacterium]